MKERRRQPRASCRLHCRIATGKTHVRARIVDISEGGMCLISPVWLKPKQEYDVSVDVPGTGLSRVRAEIWHIRRETSRTTKNKVWVVGVSLLDADDAYAKLLRAAGLAAELENPEKSEDASSPGSSRPPASGSSRPLPPPTSESIDTIEPRVFRIRCKARGGPRTRVLTLAARDRAEATELAMRDLGKSWSVIEVRET